MQKPVQHQSSQINKPDNIHIKIENETETPLKKKNNDKELFDKNFHYSFYLFVNPTSGGNKAAEFTKLEAEIMTLHLDNPKEKDNKQKYTVDVYFTNLFKEEERERGFNRLKEEIERGQTKCRAVVCGGDGTVMWVVEEMIKYKVDVEQCPIGIVAFGTGNDFSRVLGWGASAPGSVIGQNLNGLKALIQKWIFSQIVNFDIWDITVAVDEHKGHFKQVKKIDGKTEKNPMRQTIVDQNGKPTLGGEIKTIKKHMSNYCSVGVDARIGYGFDKSRTKSQIGNKCVYAWEGFKKFFTTTYKMNDIVDRLEIKQEDNNQTINNNIVNDDKQLPKNDLQDNKEKESEIQLQIKPNNESKICFKGRNKKKDKENNDDKDVPFLKENPVCIICQNINSYGGGALDMWKATKNKLGVESKDKKKLKDEFENQNFGDGQLEFLTFGSGLKLSLEQISRGNSLRSAQGNGPFYLHFKPEDDKGKIIKTYFQIDGEFYQAYCPKYIKFELAKALPKGKIKVMAKIK